MVYTLNPWLFRSSVYATHLVPNSNVCNGPEWICLTPIESQILALMFDTIVSKKLFRLNENIFHMRVRFRLVLTDRKTSAAIGIFVTNPGSAWFR